MKEKSKVLHLFGAFAMVIFLFAPTEGLTAAKPSVTIHNIIDLTGAYAPIAIPSEKGGKDYLAWIAEQGGLDVFGRAHVTTRVTRASRMAAGGC